MKLPTETTAFLGMRTRLGRLAVQRRGSFKKQCGMQTRRTRSRRTYRTAAGNRSWAHARRDHSDCVQLWSSLCTALVQPCRLPPVTNCCADGCRSGDGPYDDIVVSNLKRLWLNGLRADHSALRAAPSCREGLRSAALRSRRMHCAHFLQPAAAIGPRRPGFG